MTPHDATTGDDPTAIALVWAYIVPIVAIIAGATWVSQLDYGSRERILISAMYFLVPLCLLLGLLGRYAKHVGFVLVATTFCSGLLYSGDVGGGWSHGVAGGMTTANAIVAGLVLLIASAARDHVIRWRATSDTPGNGGEPTVRPETSKSSPADS